MFIWLPLLLFLFPFSPQTAHATSDEASAWRLSAGVHAYRGGLLTDAVAYLEPLARGDAVVADYGLYFLAETYVRMGRYDEALRTFEEIIKNYPDSIWQRPAHERAGDVSLVLGRYDDALGYYRTPLLQRGKGLPRIIYKVSLALERAGRRDEAGTFVKELFVAFPQTLYGEIVEKSGEMDGRLMSRPLTPDELQTRGRRLYGARRYEEVIGEITPFLEVNEEEGVRYPHLTLLLARAFYGKGDYETALSLFLGLFAEGSRGGATELMEKALYGAVRCYLRLGDVAEARGAIETFLDLYPESDTTPVLLMRLADLDEGEGDPDGGLPHLEEVLERYPDTAHAERAAWRLSWRFYRRGDLERSIGYLALLENYKSSRERALYWRAKAAQRLGRNDEASTSLNQLAGGSINYYAYRARDILHGSMGLDGRAKTLTKGEIEEGQSPEGESNTAFDRVRLLLAVGLEELALLELKRADPWKSPREASILYGAAGELAKSISLAAGQVENVYSALARLLLPLGYAETVDISASEYGVDPLLIYAVIMQESGFDPESFSRAGAMGLMQIMPATGEYIADGMGELNGLNRHNLFHPETNIHFGAWYLRRLLERFDGSVPYALAAYNAGPGRVSSWLEGRQGGDMDEFIEDIPFRETRNYVKKVLGYYDAYRRLYGE
ncbi:MAG: transglycosylase SLT domain-containing protein [Thermodesulfobacteriota bacterium]